MEHKTKNDPAVVGSGGGDRPSSTPVLLSHARRTREELLEALRAELEVFSHDELRIIGVRVERMAKAIRQYGSLDLATDRRDWLREAAEENIDRGFYRDCLLVALQLEEERERKACEAADRAFARVEPGLVELAANSPRTAADGDR